MEIVAHDLWRHAYCGIAIDEISKSVTKNNDKIKQMVYQPESL